jgi:predicted SAM-dependent methyltransferase
MKYLNLGCGNRYNKSWVNIDFAKTCSDVIAHNLLLRFPFEDNTFDVVYHSHLLEHFTLKDAKTFMGECCRVLKVGGIIRVVVPDLEQICRLYLKSLERADLGEQEWKANYQWIMLEMFDQCVRNQSGGEILKYLLQEPIPNETFLAGHLGSYYKVLRQGISSNKQHLLRMVSSNPIDLTEAEIGRFRKSGEVHQWMYDRYSLRILLENIGFHEIKIWTAYESYLTNWQGFHLDTDADGSIYKADSLYMEGIK